ncbi:MAG: MBL fold metallo-hydrolase [Deltaproteobacteria bacterium]|nr:MBL fold metallo-hydrolase [Deltaproteobacteria bacterium]
MTTLPPWLVSLKLPMPATLGSVNVYLIRGPSGTALIDTGMNDATSRKQLSQQLGDLGLALEDIDTVVCTHHHADHAGLGKTFNEAGAVTMMSAIDAESLELFFKHPELDSERATFFGRHAVPESFAERIAPMFPFFRGLTERFTPTVLLEDGQEISLGGIRFQVLVTPGHTRGHICLKQDKGVLFTGDCITPTGVTHVSMRQDIIGTDPLGGFIESLNGLREQDVPVVLSGHGPAINDLDARIEDILAHHMARQGQVEEALSVDTPRSAFDVSFDAMGARSRSFARWLAMGQTLAYLEHLVRIGRVEQTEMDEGRYGYLRVAGPSSTTRSED